MEQVRLHNYRCFRQEQTARLGRLTLLVGENSTGKTSFLAILRALWNIASRESVPNFREPPYDLGRFREIAHHRGARGRSASTFSAGFTAKINSRRDRPKDSVTFTATFGKRDAAPFPTARRLDNAEYWIEHRYRDAPRQSGRHGTFRFGTRDRAWEFPLPDDVPFAPDGSLIPLRMLTGMQQDAAELAAPDGATEEDWTAVRHLIWGFHRRYAYATPYAGAPVRSRPLRTYDPRTFTPDPEGEYIPLYLANLRSGHSAGWESLKSALESFGREAGLFDEIDVKLLGDADGGPFEIQVRKSGKSGRRLKGPHRNLADLGYGVSQVLPIVTELLKRDPQPMFLLQQPEVHLHPSAQAALGSLLCEIAARGGPQLVIETHSDHLLDRVRMDVRDGRTGLSPDDVSVLYFESENLDVRIHSLGIDDQGNVLHAPDSYRQFFLSETQRSLGL